MQQNAARTPRSREGRRGVCLVALLILSVLSCGPKQNAAQLPEAEQTPVVPAPVHALQLMPKDAATAIVVLSPNRLAQKTLATSTRLFSSEAAADAFINKALTSIAQALGIQAPSSFSEFIALTGIDADAPLGVFYAPASHQGDPAEPVGGPVDEATTGNLSIPPNNPDGSFRSDGPPASPVEQSVAAAAKGAIAVVFQCLDAQRAAALLEGNGASGPSGPVDGVNVAVHPNGKRYYAPIGPGFVAGNSRELVTGVLARSHAPLEVRYGTPDCPASPSDELVALVQADKALPAPSEPRPLPVAPGAETAEAANGGLARYAEAFKGGDPLVFTLAVDDTRVALSARIDGQTHPRLRSLRGPISPLAQAQMFPEDLLALVSFGLSPERKEVLQAAWTEAVPETARKSPDVAQAQAVTELVLASVGREVTLAVKASDSPLPTVLAAVDLANVSQTKAFLQAVGLPLEQRETHSGVEILSAPIPISSETPLSACFAFVGDMLLLATDLPTLHTMIDRAKNGTASSLFAAQHPPLDPAQPREVLLVLKGRLIAQVIAPLLKAQGALDEATAGMLDNAARDIQEIRFEKTISGTWYEDRLVAQFSSAIQSNATISR